MQNEAMVALIGFRDELQSADLTRMRALASVHEFNEIDVSTYESVRVVAIRRGRLDGSRLDALPGLRGVVKWGVGVDNIDLDACRRLGIPVAITPAATESVAEAAFALLIIIVKRIDHMRELARSGRTPSASDRGGELFNKTLALLGFGRIAQHAARIAAGFKMQVIAFDPIVETATFRAYGVERVFDLETLLERADFLSIHCPLNQDTRHLISDAELRRMKPSAVLINTARGGVIDEAALYRALADGRLAAAGLDVFEDEPVSPGNPLVGLPNVVATPHFLAATQETRDRTSRAVADAACAFLVGEAPQTVLP